MFPSASPRGTLRVSGKQNSLFPLWPVVKCLLTGFYKSGAPRQIYHDGEIRRGIIDCGGSFLAG